MLQGAATNRKARSSKMGVVISSKSRSIFKFGLISITTSFVDDIRPSAVVENSNARKESGLTFSD